MHAARGTTTKKLSAPARKPFNSKDIISQNIESMTLHNEAHCQAHFVPSDSNIKLQDLGERKRASDEVVAG
ncbi:hypothetical protein [Xanthomonas arboricola]|uniref:hypothetical protein n=1 Tax=Xanthomonas arboricola TaxID=56448 RepID=UPI001C87B040|nr:hypothetical protein [Xanthomonas arboricola]